MKGLITCAGMGTRLGLLTEKNNKTLLKINGKSIIEVILDTFNRYGIKDVVVVTGHSYDKVEGLLKNKVKFAYNPFYQISGILCSIWFSRRFLEGSDFIFVTGDSVFHPRVLELCMKTSGDIVMCIEKKKCDAEDSKVVIKNGKITDIGKNISVKDAVGEFTGMLKVSAKASKVFFQELDLILKETRLNAYVADLLLRLKDKGIKLVPVYTESHTRVEIDYPEDLEAAKKLYMRIRAL